jgi:hypothetical protein
MFSIHQTIPIQDFLLDVEIPIPTTKEKYVSNNAITGSYAIKPLEEDLQNMFNVAYSRLIKKWKKTRKPKFLIN